MKKTFKMVVASSVLAVSLYGAADFTIVKHEEVLKHFEAKSALILDARPYKLYQAGTIPGAVHMDYKEYGKLKKFLPADKNIEIISFCNGVKCEHSDHLADLLKKDGYTNVVIYKGGYPEWKEKNKPQMGLIKECKENKVGETYKPQTPLVTIKGAQIHLIKGDNTMIDQFWFSSIVLSNPPQNVQLVDVRKPEHFKEGHLKGAINVPFENGKIDLEKLPKDKVNVLYCNTGMMSTDAITSIKNNDGSILYIDATIECKGDDCKITPNELLE